MYRTKKEYYILLQKAMIAISFAEHENWGIAMQDALFSDCLLLVPNKCSYPEMYDPTFQYNSLNEFEERLIYFIALCNKGKHNTFFYDEKQRNKSTLLKKGREAIPNIITEMYKIK